MKNQKTSGSRHDKQAGQALTEYIILVLMIAVVSVTVTRSLGKTIKGKLRMARDHISQEVSLDE